MERQVDGQSGAREDRLRGKAMRSVVPRSEHAQWDVKTDRTLPLELLAEQSLDRLAYLIPERHARMSASPFAFYRGGALLMANDLSSMPTTGLMVQACGDAHIANFGGFASADRRLVFDINDFDETAAAPWEWDVKRLAASIEICGRHRGFKPSWRRAAVRSAVQSYREAMNAFANQGALDVWHARLDVGLVLAHALAGSSRKDQQRVRKQLEKAFSKTSTRAFDKLVQVSDGQARILFDPPYLVPLDRFAPAVDVDAVIESLIGLLERYRESLSPEMRYLFDQYDYLDAAQKVVGVGSVGTRAWIVAFVGRDGGDPLVLQIKEAQASVLERYCGPSACLSHGERVVRGQRFMQASGDILLGWTSAPDESGVQRDYYVRQLWDWKTSTDLETASASEIEACGRLCGWTLARAHARSGDRCAIAGYLGSSTTFDCALADFAVAYANQNEADYQVFIDALASGVLPAAPDAG